ncbi:transcriptional activator srcap [Fusarium beomiforme]|uniref:Transcriptional activator srcap n=1 Tax=Fusarium beomiforme TaxID=44412 RepID=A0A9P5A6M0_9HYPO|nr:transcriptional activator srcap [Fusarium beomiforme]
MPLIESIAVQSLDLTYHYAPVEVEPSEGKEKKVTKVMGSQFEFKGVLLAAGLELGLNFNYEPNGTFTFKATLSSSKKSATVEMSSRHKDTEKKDPKPDEKPEDAAVKLAETKKGSFQFVATVNIDKLSFSFIQIHRLEWAPKTPSKRFFKAALTAVPDIDIPLVGNLTQPFQEMYFMWIQDDTKLNKGGDAGLTRKDLASLEKTLPLTVKDKFKPPTTDDDLLMSAGSHFGVIIKDSEGNSSCILDYDLKKKASSTPEKQGGGSKALTASRLAAIPADEKEPEKKAPKDDSDGGSASAPFRKKTGPLSISNISLKYVDNVLRIGFNATFELGPLSFSLLGFTINLKLTSLDLSKIEFPEFSLEGFSVAFDRPPLTIAGIVRRGDTEELTFYSGGLIVGWVPYQPQAAGFYGEAHPVKDDKKKDFVSVFVFARLDGPLVTLEFAEISGVTGGFGYKSEVRVPKASEITDFPFINQSQLDGSSGGVLKTLEALTNPDAAAGGCFSPQDDSYWAAAGMKIDAFQMISLDAVMVVMFGQSIKLGIYAVALIDIPNPKSPVKFAHVELGIGVTVDFAYGTMKAEGQLSPKSFILDPKLPPHWRAFRIPVGWPNPPRLDISWSLGKNLSISGEAYFAITPKVCMGGGRLHAAFSAGPISAWFDAFANFLINYKPFSFNVNAGVCVGVRFDIDFLFIHTHISVEISADLYLWGPPLAGRVHVDIKVAKFDINFGSSKSSDPAVDMLAFYNLVLQAGSQKTNSVAAREEEETSLVEEADKDVITQPMNQGHTLLATSGLLNNNASPERSQNADWVVRGGSFAFVVGCKMAAQDALLVDENDKTLNSVSNKEDSIYAKPMHLGKETPMTKSEVKIEIIQNGDYGARIKIDSEGGHSAKSRDGNNINDLLDDNEGSVKLMMGVLMQGPPAVMSKDTLKAFDILDAGLEDLPADKNFPDPGWSDKSWEPDEPKKGAAQWDVVHDKWKSPDWNEGEAKDVQTGFVDTWAKTFGWDSALSGLAKIPKLLDERFNSLYVGAPLITK